MQRNPGLAESVVIADGSIDQLQRDVQEQAIRMIAMRQPMAHDLRHAVSVLKLAAELERIGDLAKNIALRAMTISGAEQPRTILVGLEHMTELAGRQLKDVLDAWSARDGKKALGVWRGDAGLDALYNSVFRDLLARMMEDPRDIEHSTHLLFVAKNLERIGDHTTNIAEQILYLITGVTSPRDRIKGDDTSTFSTQETAT